MTHDDTGQAPDTTLFMSELSNGALAMCASAGDPAALDEWRARQHPGNQQVVITGAAAERAATIDVAQQAFREAIRPAQLAYQDAIKPHSAAFDAAVEAAQKVYQARMDALAGTTGDPAQAALSREDARFLRPPAGQQ